jgi:hypothetical protein
VQAVAKTVFGSRTSRVIVKTSESSIMPALITRQVLPESVVFQGRCQVPA